MMTDQITPVPKRTSPGSSNQDPENRATDPNPLGKDSMNSVTNWFKGVPWAEVATQAGVSGIYYTGANYLVHKAMKPESSKKDPNAIKTFTPGRILRQGGTQFVAAGLSSLTAHTVVEYTKLPSKYANYTKPVLTGVYKSLGSLALEGVPTAWNWGKDFILSVGSDYLGTATVGYLHSMSDKAK